MADIEPMESSLSSSDSDSDDSDAPGMSLSPEDAQSIMDAEDHLEGQPYDYDGHIKYISLLRKCGLHVKLEEARQAMRALFPLGQQLWLEWLDDAEREAQEGRRTTEEVRTLYDLATADYMSIDIWKRYIRFMTTAYDKGALPAETVRAVLEGSVQSGGLHVRRGASLWDDFVAFECVIHSRCEPGSPECGKQVERVAAVYRRQLSLPLEHNEAAFAAWQQLAATPDAAVGDVAGISSAYKEAQRAARLRQPFEDRIEEGLPADTALLEAFEEYIAFERSQEHPEPARCQLLYERAVVTFPVSYDLWLRYGRFLEEALPRVHGLVLAVYAQACRNCPWIASIWERRMRAIHRAWESAPDEAARLERSGQHAAAYCEALAAAVQTADDVLGLCCARCHMLRCQGDWQGLHATYEAAENLLQSRFPEQSREYALSLTGYVAESFVADSAARSAESGDGLERGRRVWEGALRSGAGRRRPAWAEAIAFELRRGHADRARSLYKRCHSRRLEDGGQPALCQEWLAFEGLHGSGWEHLEATLKVEPILEAAQTAAAAAHETAQPKRQLEPEELLARRRANDPHYKSEASKPGKRRIEPYDESDRQLAAKKAKAGSATDDTSTERTPTRNERAEHELEAPTAAAKSAQERHVVFVKHLASNVDEDELRNLFEKCGKLVDVRLGLNPKTRQTKGFAYLEFETTEGLHNACKLDRTEFHGKHIFVAPSNKPAFLKDKPPHDAAMLRQSRAAEREMDGATGGTRSSAGKKQIYEDEGVPHVGPATTMKPRLGGLLVPRAATLTRRAPRPAVPGAKGSSVVEGQREQQMEHGGAAGTEQQGSDAGGHDNGSQAAKPATALTSNEDFRAMLLGK